jgi:cell division protein FtsL
MIRITTLLWVALLVVAGGTVMHVSYQVRHVEKHISELTRDTRQEQDAIRILSAEWDSLNDPHRIDELAKRHLALEPTPIARVVTLEAIPLKLSEEQVARLTVASAKTAKPQATAAKAPATPSPAKKPEILVNATTRANPVMSAPVQQDSVGLILARAERRQ